MKIGGLEKSSLSDYPGKIAAVVFLPGCNFNCPWCQNKDLVNYKLDGYYSTNYVLNFLEDRRSFLDGVTITGGDPLVHGDSLLQFISKIKKMEYDIKLDHNGSKPRFLETLLNKSLLNYVAMDLKAPLEKYEDVIGVNFDTDFLKESIRTLTEYDVRVEYRTTLIPQLSKQDIRKIIESLVGPCEKYVLQKYKEPDRGMKNIDGEGLDPEDISKELEGDFPEINIQHRK